MRNLFPPEPADPAANARGSGQHNAGIIEQSETSSCPVFAIREDGGRWRWRPHGSQTVRQVGRSLLDLCHPEDRPHDAALFEQLADGMIAEFSRNKRLLHKDGSVTQVRSRVSVLHDEQRRPWRAVAVLENTAEHVRLEEAERARESAEASNRAKSNFLSRMSHELRTPLNGVLGYAQILDLDATLTERQRLGVKVIGQAGRHLLTLIDDILDLSRIEAGRLDLAPSPVDLRAFVRAKLARPTAGNAPVPPT